LPAIYRHTSIGQQQYLCELFAVEYCPMCLGAIFWARIGRVVYAAAREDTAKIGGCAHDHLYDQLHAAGWREA
jgi:tRNA(Arg) A34 adenosine deaminase TadA